MRPLGIVVSQNDGQISLIDPFLTSADKEFGSGSGGRNGATRVKMEPNDNNERAAARPPAQDGASTYIKREVEEVMIALIHECESKDLTLQGFYEQTSFPAEGSPTMMEVIADMNEKCANERRINQDLGAIIQDLQSANNALHSVNQTLMLQGGSAQVLSDKNQQIANQVRMIQDLQRRVEYLERFGRYRR